MADVEETPCVSIESAAIQYSKWNYDHIYMHYAFSADGRYVYKWNFASVLVVDTFHGLSRQFTNEEKLRIRDFHPLFASCGLLLYSQNRRTFIARLEFQFPCGDHYELHDRVEIREDCRDYGGTIIHASDNLTRGAIFLTRNSPGDVFIFYSISKNQKISVEQTIETQDREYLGFPCYIADSVYYFRMAYEAGERPFEALKILERTEATKMLERGEMARSRSVNFGPMLQMNRRDLMHRTRMPKFHGSWSNNGTFFLSVNIDPLHYFALISIQALKRTELKIPRCSSLHESRIHVSDDHILTIHDEGENNKLTCRPVHSYRLAMRNPETLQNLAFFAMRRYMGYGIQRFRLPNTFPLRPIFEGSI